MRLRVVKRKNIIKYINVNLNLKKSNSLIDMDLFLSVTTVFVWKKIHLYSLNRTKQRDFSNTYYT